MSVLRGCALGLAWLGTTVCVAATFASCAAHDDVASSSAATTATLLDGGAINPMEQEPSAVFADRSLLVVGYNDERSALVPGGSTMGWARSFNNGVTFTKCNANAPCNGSGVDVSRVTGFRSFLRHPSLATDGKGHVVYVTLADTDGDPSTAERVVAVLSSDYGQTFTTAFPVNQDSCANGVQDMPYATFDYTTSPATLWIVWRHNGSGGSFGGCIRRFFIDKYTGELVALDPSQDVVGMEQDDPFFGSQGALEVQAGDGIVTVAYVDSDDDHPCPSGSHHGQAWGSVSTIDNAHNWVDNARIFHTSDWRSCLLHGGGGLHVQNTIRSFDFVRAPSGIEYAVLADTKRSVRFFMNAGGGVKGWRDPTDTQDPWMEWCPGTPTGTGTTSNWKHHDDGPCGHAFLERKPPATFTTTLLPTIAADGNGRVAIGLFTFEAKGKKQRPTVLLRVNPNPLLPGSQFVAPPTAVAFSPELPESLSIPQETVFQPFGAYFQMLAREPTGELVTPGCSASGDFYPFWVQRANDGTPQIATRGVVVQ